MNTQYKKGVVELCVLAISAGSVRFWHAWGWFGYQG